MTNPNQCHYYPSISRSDYSVGVSTAIYFGLGAIVQRTTQFNFKRCCAEQRLVGLAKTFHGRYCLGIDNTVFCKGVYNPHFVNAINYNFTKEKQRVFVSESAWRVQLNFIYKNGSGNDFARPGNGVTFEKIKNFLRSSKNK